MKLRTLTSKCVESAKSLGMAIVTPPAFIVGGVLVGFIAGAVLSLDFSLKQLSSIKYTLTQGHDSPPTV